MGVGLVSVVILVWAFLSGGTRAQPGFFQTAAQIIPVFFLALAIEGLLARWSSWLRVCALGLLVAGEVAALVAAALATQQTQDGEHLVRCTAKIVGWGSTRCSQKLTDLLGSLTCIGLIVGLVAVVLTTLTVRAPAVNPAAGTST